MKTLKQKLKSISVMIRSQAHAYLGHFLWLGPHPGWPTTEEAKAMGDLLKDAHVQLVYRTSKNNGVI